MIASGAIDRASHRIDHQAARHGFALDPCVQLQLRSKYLLGIAIANQFDSAEQTAPADVTDMVVRLYGDTAIVTYDLILQVPPQEDQGPPPRYQHWTSVWTRQGDTWKLKFQQTTPTHWGDW